MLVFTSRPNAEGVLINLLKQLDFSFDADSITNELITHPDYPSLLAINDVALSFGLDCQAYRIAKDDLPDVPCPFVANMVKQGSEFMLVSAISNGTVSFDAGIGRKKIGLKEFEKDFTGVVLVAENAGKQKNNTTNLGITKAIRSKFYLIAPLLLVLAFVAGVSLHLMNSPIIGWPYVLLLFFKSAGFIISVLLLIQSIDQNNPLIQKLCGGGGKTNCNAILSSKAATVFKGLSWSEVGFFYFSGTWLALLFGGSSPSLLLALAVLNIISLPYTFYSIYYQAKIAKQWCKLCCAVQALLWLEFFCFISFSPGLFNAQNLTLFTLSDALTLFTSFAVPIAFWLLLKPLFLKVQQLKPFKNQLRGLKYNKEFFDSLLQAQPKYALPDEDWSIILGNVEAENIITMVSNPYCPPCAKTHQILDEWLNKRNDLQVRLVFTANNLDTDIKTPVTRHLMALNTQPDKSTVKEALHDWYGQKQKNYPDWAKVYPVQLDEDQYYKIDKQKAWCEMAEIKATPTFLINGYRLPEAYQLTDIKYLLN